MRPVLASILMTPNGVPVLASALVTPDIVWPVLAPPLVTPYYMGIACTGFC